MVNGEESEAIANPPLVVVVDSIDREWLSTDDDPVESGVPRLMEADAALWL